MTHLLDWQPVDAGPTDTVTTNGSWTVTVDQAGSGVRMDGAAHTLVIPAGPSRRISNVLLDETYAVVVAQDKQEVRPSAATVVTLDDAQQRRLPVTLSGGTWTMYDGNLLHATYASGRRYCLEQVDLDSLAGRLVHCAPPRHGFSEARMSPAGTTLLTFDSRPSGSCRTPSEISDSAQPLPGITQCHGWDSLLTSDGQIWSVVPRENQIEQAEFFASYGNQTVDLGLGTTGSLTWCGDSAYFVRDSQKDVDKASADALDARPRARGRLRVASRGQRVPLRAALRRRRPDHHRSGERGDEQVSANVS